MGTIKNIFGNKFLVSIITLISGSAIAQALLFFAGPLLSRLYSPSEFGVFGVYAAIVAIVASVASLKYELAIVLPKDDEDANALVSLSVVITFVVAIFSLAGMLLLRDFLNARLSYKVDNFIWIIPVGILFSGLFQVFLSYNTRKKKYQNISAGRISQAGMCVGAQTAFHQISTPGIGLVWGKIIGDAIGFVVMLWASFEKGLLHLNKSSWIRMKNNANVYKDFAIYQSPARLLNSLSANLPYMLFAMLFNEEMVGFYMMTARVLTASSTLIGQSTRQVFLKEASALHAKGKSFYSLFKKTTLGLGKLAFLPYLLVGIFAPNIFAFVFGSEWYVSGQYAQLIILWSFMGILNPPSTASIYILGLQRISLIYEIVSLFIRFLAIYVSWSLFDHHLLTVGVYGLSGFALNLFLILYMNRRVKHHHFSVKA